MAIGRSGILAGLGGFDGRRCPSAGAQSFPFGGEKGYEVVEFELLDVKVGVISRRDHFKNLMMR
jgi:hypothetical protein